MTDFAIRFHLFNELKFCGKGLSELMMKDHVLFCVNIHFNIHKYDCKWKNFMLIIFGIGQIKIGFSSKCFEKKRARDFFLKMAEGLFQDGGQHCICYYRPNL